LRPKSSPGGGRAVAIGADLRSSTGPSELVDASEAALGPVDVLVANAGLGRTQQLEDISSDDFDETIAVNLRAPFLLAQRTLRSMRERGFGRVLFMSSVAAFTGGIVGPHYAASKAGLHGLTHFLAGHVAADGVTVNALAPALIVETGLLPGDPEQLRQLGAGRQARGGSSMTAVGSYPKRSDTLQLAEMLLWAAGIPYSTLADDAAGAYRHDHTRRLRLLVEDVDADDAVALLGYSLPKSAHRRY
jgi:NAD(P)-dependent dehydrogenase (short-subunit alcohol dehydrogenase family)